MLQATTESPGLPFVLKTLKKNTRGVNLENEPTF